MGKEWVLKPGTPNIDTHIKDYRELVDHYLDELPDTQHVVVLNVDFWIVYFIVTDVSTGEHAHKDVALMDNGIYKMVPREIAGKLADTYLVHMHYLAEARNILGMDKGE